VSHNQRVYLFNREHNPISLLPGRFAVGSQLHILLSQVCSVVAAHLFSSVGKFVVVVEAVVVVVVEGVVEVYLSPKKYQALTMIIKLGTRILNNIFLINLFWN
jgi:hypothetical protein